MTPLRWLHATVLLVGRAADLIEPDLDQMLTKARIKLNGTPSASVTLGRVIYHPEGIVLPMTPASAPGPDLRGCPGRHPRGHRQARRHQFPRPVLGSPRVPVLQHSQQPAAPIIAALGRSLSAREAGIDKLSLVIQHGPALSWDWRPVGTAHLGQQGGIERAFSPGERRRR